MLIKAVTLFLVLMAAGAIYYRLRSRRTPPGLARPKSCPKCGRHRIGRGACPCLKKG